MKKSRLVAMLVAALLIFITATLVSALSHYVVWGDTLWDLSRYYGTSIDAIVQVNPQITNPNLIYAGDTLEIPVGVTVTPGPTSTSVPPNPTVPSGTFQYVVRPGDTLSSIARKFNTTVNAIMSVNPQISNPNLIYAGQVILIPGSSGGYPTPIPPGTTVTPAPTSVPPPSSGFELGGQTLVLAYPDYMRQAGMNWAKFQYKWTAGDDPNALSSVINAGHDQGFKVLISVAGEDDYPAPGSINFASYKQFMAGLAALGPEAIEVWNEQNIDFEWPAGEISPVSYTNNMLAPSYQAIKSVNPSIMVISGALAPTGFDNSYNAWADNRYLQGMYQAGAANYMDCIGAHHNAGATSPTQTVGHPADTTGHYSWYFLPTLNLYYNTFAGQRPVCFTELGYLSPEGFPGVPPNFSWAVGTSVAEQAQWLAEAATLSRNSGKVRLMTVFNVDYSEYDMNGDPQAGYAIIRPDQTCPACVTLGAVMGGG
ncbi:MAG: LysM peptidoglycan-binding domain-containing protein [Anaerolineae bacterium]|nr:LysM peptidoglycan-binding domain-containing protein [Anaerolineae bacterium]